MKLGKYRGLDWLGPFKDLLAARIVCQTSSMPGKHSFESNLVYSTNYIFILCATKCKNTCVLDSS